jgi:MoaA/NifB/PqqE/SkfB family radical SAM enzyme
VSFYNNENWPEKSKYYRWPWSNNDNPVQWLEATDLCNIHCKGCYRSYMEGHRPLEVLKKEIDFCIKNRNIDTVCIAGGEPLIYPEIVKLVEFIAKRGLKPNIITNTVAMTKRLVTDLYNAGIFGFTNHIDMMQKREGWKPGMNELDLMPMRQKVADLIYEVGKRNIYTTFNVTTYHENFKYIPDIVNWVRSNVQKVNGIEFITYRGMPVSEGVEWDVEETKHETHQDLLKKFGYAESDKSQLNINSVDIYNLLKDNFGDSYEPMCYLGGTGHIKEYKWWAQAGVMDKNGKNHGSVGPKTMEFLQIAHHWFKGRYFMYLKGNTAPRFLILLTALIGDKAMAPVRKSILLSLLNPLNWFRPVYFQSVGINQPPDMLENGMASMCESCPDVCVWEDNLVSSCRLDEYRKYGKMLNVIAYEMDTDKRPKKKSQAKA